MELRDLPSIDAMASTLEVDFDLPRPLVVEICRGALDDARDRILRGEDAAPADRARETLEDISAARPRPIVNATGVLLHTNLGRASIHIEAAAAFSDLAASASNVEIDVRTGRRSRRYDYLRSLLPPLTGAEAGFAVNNNAGALLLALASIAGEGGRVAVSRGELIEIGGSFRLPELMKASGASLVEVGTTNRTRLSDYEAVVDTVDAVLKVHPSNYRIQGFQEDVDHVALAELCRAQGVPFIFDVGSGLIDERAPWLGGRSRAWLAGEPGVIQATEAGASLVLFSGDKLLGGPQAGVIVGSSRHVEAAMRHPVARAVRLDGPTIAALAATVELYLEHRVLELPFWQMASASASDIEARARRVIRDVAGASIEPGGSIPGAGSVPGLQIPTHVIRLDGEAEQTWSHLARRDPSVIGTRRDGAVYLDLRSVLPSDDSAIRGALLSLGS